MELKEIISDPDFLGLPFQERAKVLSTVDSDFRNLTSGEQIKVVHSIRLKTNINPDIPVLETQQPAHAPATRSWTGDLPAIGGGILGGFANTIRQRIPYAGILAGGGEAYHQLYQRATNDPNAPQTSEEAAKRIANLGMEQSLGQVGGELITKGLGKLIPRVKEQFMVPDRTGAEETLRGYMDPYLNKGISERMMDKLRSMVPESMQWEQAPKPGFTIAQKSDPLSGAHRVEQIIESSFFGAKPIKEFKLAQQRGLESWAKDAAEEVWQGTMKMSPEQRGQAFIEGFDAAEDVFREGAKAKYAAVDKLLGQESINISSVKDAGTKLAIKNEQFKGIGSSDAGDTLIKQIVELPNKMTFADASELRSRLIKVAKSSRGDVAGKNAHDFVSRIDKAMEQTALSLGDDAKIAWRGANSFYKQGKQTFDNNFISGLVEKGREQPELVGKGLFQNGEISQIKMAKNALKDDLRVFQSMKAGWLEDVFIKSKKSDGAMVGNAFFNQLKGMGDDTLKEIFTGPELALIRKFEEASTKTQKLGSAGGGTMLIQLMQAGALGGIISGQYFQQPELIAGGVALLASPRVFGNMFVNPRYHNLFYRGLSTSKPIAIPAITKLATEAIMVNDQLKEQSAMEDK